MLAQAKLIARFIPLDFVKNLFEDHEAPSALLICVAFGSRGVLSVARAAVEAMAFVRDDPKVAVRRDGKIDLDRLGRVEPIAMISCIH